MQAPNNQETKLTWASTDDLVDELIRRHDGIVIAGVKFTNVNGEYVGIRRYSGHLFTCSALCAQMQHIISKEEISRVVDLGDNKDR